MFKRDNEQPLKASFEEKKNNKEKRSLRERLSSIPVRRRVEAVLLAVVTIMASLSIDWSSLLASAASDPTIESGQSISTVYEAAADNKKLTSAKISVKIPLADKEVEVSYTWKVYQNLTDKSDPESGVPVGNGGSGTIYCGSKDFVDVILSDDPTTKPNGILPDVVLLDDETAAVVFKLTSKDSSNITCKSFGTADSTYVKDKDDDWNGPISGKAIDYTADDGTLTDVTLSDFQNKIGLTAGQSYTFPDITWTPAYRRKLEFNVKNAPNLLIEKTEDSTFTVGDNDNIGNGGEAIITVGGTGVKEKDVTVKVVSFALKGSGTGNSVFPYTGSSYKPADLYTAKCGNEINNITTYFQTTFEVDGTSVTAPQDPGSYTMTITGKGDYAGLSYTTDFTIEQGILTQAMFDGSTATVKSGVIEGITDGTFSTSPLRKLVWGEDFDAKVTNTSADAGEVTYTVTITGKNNFKNGNTAPTLTATETSGVSLDSFVDHIGFKAQTGNYDGTPQKPEIVFYDSNNNAIEAPAFTYEVKYNGIERSTGNPVTDALSIINAGEYTATVEGTGIYSGSFTTPATYVLKPISFTKLTGLTVTLKKAYFEESDPFVIEVDKVTYDSGKKELADGTYVLKDDYSREVGTHNVTILGNGNYEGEATAQYTVFPSLLTCATFELKGDDDNWVKTAGTLTADNTTDAWDYVLTHNRAYTYKGSAIEPDIRANVNGETLSVASGTNPMTKSAGVNNKDVTSSGSKAYFILTLPEKYAGKKIKVEFEIEPAQLGTLSFTTNLQVKSYTGAAIELEDNEFEVKDKNGNTLIKGTDYTIDDKSYKNNVNAGTATITATGNGNYTGTASNTFTINPIDIKDVDITINDQQLNISGKTVITNMDDVVITKTIHDDYGVDKEIRFSSEDFTLSNYANNEHAWIDGDTTDDQPQVTIKGKRNLTEETRVEKFQILNKTLTGLTWKLAVSGDSYEGVLGSPGTTINLSDPKYGYVVDYAPSLPAAFIKIYDSNGKKMNPGNYTYVETPSEAEGKNTITIVGKGDYRGGEYYFTYDVRKRDINDCVFKQETDGSSNVLPTYTLKDRGNDLTKDTDYETDFDTVMAAATECGDDYEVTFKGKGSYTGEKKVKFHIGTPFNSDNVFITMYGPNGTGTVGSENRLTYFGDNDPYFILTSDKADSSKTIGGPSYSGGFYSDTNEEIYDITFNPSNRDARHKVGTTVTVTFTAKKDNGVWYNPGNKGITYSYKVMPGVGAFVSSDYPNLQSYLWIYTKYSGATPGEDGKKDFPTIVTNNLIPFSDFKFPYTTEGKDPEIYICYDPPIGDGAYATQCSSVPAAPTGGEGFYAAPVKVKFNDSSLFTVSRGLISANDEDKKIIMTPVRTGWLGASNDPPKIEVNYSFTAAKLSDAAITPKDAEYTYSGAAVNLDYTVTIGSSTTLIRDTDYKVVGYYKYPSEATTEKTKIDSAINNPSSITKETNFDGKLTDPPKDVGEYFFVIGPASNSNYEGYNIAKFEIKPASFTAELRDPDNFFVTYGAEKKAPKGTTKDQPNDGDLIVTGATGETLYEQTDHTKDGYYIETVVKSPAPGTDAEVTIWGTGNYGGSKIVQYKSVANIRSGVTPNFEKTNLSLTDENLDPDKPLELRLKNDSGLPFIKDTSTRFDLKTLTLSLSDGTVPLQSSWLEATVSGVDGSSDSLTTVGKKKITIEKAADAPGAPVTGKREYYYVEVFADISTAEVSLRATGARVSGTEISYTGSSITVTPVLKFREEDPLNSNNYTSTIEVKEGGPFPAVGKYTMNIAGDHDRYYKGTAKKDFSIVYDLKNDAEILYQETAGGTSVNLAGKSFSYTGIPVGPEIADKIKVKVKGKELAVDQDYTLSFANDTYPGRASATITHTSTSINTQTVNFYIGGGNELEGKCTITRDPSYSYVYDGMPKTPTVTVSYKDDNNVSRQLVEGEDFAVTYSNNINVGEATVTVTGINGRYNGEVTQSFGITPKPLKDDDVSFPDEVPFGGRKDENTYYPGLYTITVMTSDGKTLQENTDYTITYIGIHDGETVDDYFSKAPGTEYKITIKGIGNYKGEVTKTATQLSGTLNNNPNITIDATMTSAYNGKKVTFAGNGPAIKNGKSTLRYGEDYTIEIPEILNAGTYPITITAVEGGDYYDNGSTKTFTYTVTRRSVEENEGAFVLTLYDPTTGNSGTSFKWTGNKIQPLVKLVDTGITGLDSSVGEIWTDVDSLKQSIMMDSFTVTYGDNRFAGKDAGSVTLNASGNYKGSITRTFSIGTDIANATLSYDKTSAEYDGTPKKQDITVRYNNNTLEAGVAYESLITYTYTDSEGNVKETTSPSAVGTYVPVIKGKTDGGYYGELKGSPFRIIAQNKTGNIKIKFSGVGGGEVDAADYVCHYNTKKQTPSISVYDTSGDTAVALTENVDYTVSYGNNTNAGSGYVYVALKGNYTGTAQEIFTIRPYDISNATLEFIEGENGIIKNVPEASFPYSPLFKLIGTDDDGKNFEISYADSRQKQDLSIPDSSKVKKPGKGSLAVSGTGNNLYGTTNAYDYEAYGRLSEKNVIVTPPINTGVKKDPEVKVVFAGETLVLDTDYSLRIVPFDQTVSGGGNVIVEGLGYFTGSVYTKYGEASDVSSLTLRGFSQQYIYSGVFAGPQESAIYAVDKDGNTVISADKLECTFTSDKDNAACITANATVTITTKATLEDGTVQDGPKATYKIVPRNINSCDIMRLENDIYTGKALKPPVAVSFRRKEYTFGSTGGIAEEKVLDVITLKEGTDYSLSYKNNVYPGTADITVTGKGNYTGTRLFHFVINVISMGSVNARRTSDGIVVSWAARPYVAGYRVLYDTEKLTAVSTTGTTVTLKDAMPTRVGVQPYILGSGKTPIYGAAKYIDVS